MNKRQAKKRESTRYLVEKSYRKNRLIVRKQHVSSIEYARLQHRNFWEECQRGYPNRFPYQKWFNTKFF